MMIVRSLLRTSRLRHQVIVRQRRNAVTVSGIPPESLLDDRLKIRIQGLDPGAEVSLHLNVTNHLRLNFDSFNYYQADKDGCVDLEGARPLNGMSYSQFLDSMGIFRTLKPRKGFHHRFWSNDVTRKFDCALTVMDSTGAETTDSSTHKVLAQVAFKRCHLSSKIRRIKVQGGRVRGTLFMPTDATSEKPVPCIITLHGGIINKGPVEDLAALLASRLGFATLALPYFGVEGLPKTWNGQPMDMTYFEDAVDALARVREIDGNKMGVYGISKGGELALTMCAFFGHKLSAVVVANVMHKAVGPEVLYRDQVLQPADVPFRVEESISDGLMRLAGPNDVLHTPDDPSNIPFFKAEAPVMLVASGDDGVIDAYGYADKAAEYAKEGGKTNCTVLKYPKMGHLIDLPYSPVATADLNAAFSRDIKVYYGGDDTEMHSFGQEDCWGKMLDFYREHLS